MEAEKAQTETEPSPGERSGSGNGQFEPNSATTGKQQNTPPMGTDGRLDDDGYDYDNDDGEDDGDGDGVVGEQKPKKPNLLARSFAKLGLDVPTLLMMFKYALPHLHLHVLVCWVPT